MANKWTIYNSAGSVTRCKVKDLEYHGEWMEDEYVSVKVTSPEPVAFALGDYLMYRGEKFEINYDPNVIKKARSGSYGEGFTYDNVKLYSVAAQLKHIGFKDVVLNTLVDNANKLVYSMQGTFQFFAGSVEDLADRIQANLNREFSNWKVMTSNWSRTYQRTNHSVGQTTWNNYYNSSSTQGKTDVSLSIENLSCWDALKLSYTAFEVPFYVTSYKVSYGTYSVTYHAIIIGGKSIQLGGDLSFEYGKGNGLYEIERTTDESARLVTKLFAYGSEKNLPINYYANIGKRAYATISEKAHSHSDYKRSDGTVENTFDAYKLYTTIPWLTVKSSINGDGSNTKVSITKNSVKHTSIATLLPYLAEGTESPQLLCIYLTNGSSSGTVTTDYESDETFYGNVSVNDKVYIDTNVNLNTWPYIYIPQSINYPALLSINRLMLPGFPTQSLFAWVVAHGATNINYQTYRATWHGYTAYFSNDATDPWIKSVNADVIGIREGSVSFDSGDEEIYPTIEGTGFDEVSWAQQIEDNGYLTGEEGSSTFELRPMTVDGDDGGIEWNNKEETVTISMKDGFCVGREFTVQKAERNSVGLWVLTLERKKDDSLERYFPYQESDVQSVHLYQILGRDNYQQATGDKFVVLGIPLPDAFVQKGAEKLLEKALKELASIDHMRYTYLPKIDEIYMAKEHDEAEEGTSLHDTLHAGMQMEFEDSDLNVHYFPFIDNITIKENGNNGIPTYDVVLRDEKDMTLQEKIQSQIEGGNDAILNIIAGSGGDTKYLSKVNDDTAKGLIRLLKGLQVGEQFLSGLGGQGGVFRTNADGKTYLECDEMYVRMRAYFDTVEIRKFLHSGGNRIASAAGAKCVYVNWLDASGNILEQTNANRSLVKKFRCYFRGEDSNGKVSNDFQVGDQAFCEVTNVESGSLASHRFWRLVVGTSGNDASGAAIVNDNGDYWIDLSNNSSETIGGVAYSGYEAGSDFPQAQDDIVQLGCVNDSTRRGAIIEYVSGNDAPSYQIFQGLGDITGATSLSGKQAKQYTFVGRNYVALGYNSSTGRAFMNVYGDFYFGARPASGQTEGNSFIRYNQETGELDVKANVDFTHPESTYGTGNLDDFIAAITQNIGDIQDQVDGNIESWFYDYMPVAVDATGAPLNKIPLVINNGSPVHPYYDWYTIDGGGTAHEVRTEREKHLGDTFYDNSSGYAFRFTLNSSTNAFEWTIIEDSAVIKALADAAKAQDTADHKRRAFVLPATIGGVTYNYPYPPYDVGDLWLNAKYPYNYDGVTDAENNKYNNDVLRCITSQDANGSFSISHWVLASKYTDDTVVNDFISNTYQPFVQNIQTQVDQKAETWYQDGDPSSAWTTAELKAVHVGDIWCDTSDNGGKKTKIWKDFGTSVNPRYAWAEQAVPDKVFDTIDGKCAIYVAWNAWIDANNQSLLQVKDLLIPQADISQTIGGVTYNYKKDKVYRCIDTSTPVFREIEYTDDTTVNNIISRYGNILGITPTAGNVGEALGYLREVLGGSTSVDGGLILSNLIAMRDNAATPSIWGGISGTYRTSETGSGFLGHGTAAWYGGAMVDKETLAASVAVEANWPTYRWARTLFRFDGSGYVADGNISWDKTGTLTIKGNVVDTTTLKIDGTTVNLSDYLPKAAGSGEALTGDLYANNIVPNASAFTASLPQYYSLGNADRFWQNLFVKRIYLYKPNANNDTGAVYIEYNTTSGSEGVHLVGAGMWTESYLSALGLNSSGGGGSGVQLSEPLSTINAAGMGAPNTTGQAIVWNGSAWVYSIYTTLRAAGLYSAGTIASYGNFTSTQGDFIAASGHGFKVTGSDNTSVLLAGGGTKPLSEIGSAYTLPAATAAALGGLKVNQSYGQAATVQASGNTGTRNYGLQIDSNGMGFVYVPWENTDNDTKNTAGATNLTATKMYLVGATTQTANPQTYTNSNCYINTDNCLYSNGSKVLTVAETGFLPLTGGTLTGDLNTNSNIKITGYNNRVFGFILTNGGTAVGDNVDVGWNWSNVDGSGAFFRSSDAGGNFGFFARSSSSNTKQLIGTPAGSLTWDGNEIATQTWVTGRGYITGITSNMVTSALGYTPANATTFDSYLAKSGGTMTGTPFIKMPASAASIGDDYPFGITYGRIQAYGDLKIIADTDGSQNEYIILTSGRGVSSATAANGLAIGYDSLKWKNNNIWHAGNLTKVSQLTNDSGYITSSGACSYAGSAGYATFLNPQSYTPTDDTVAGHKAGLVNWMNTDGNNGIGRHVIVSASVVSQWGNDSASAYPSSVYAMIKIGGGYNGSTYGQWLLSGYDGDRVGIVGRNSNQWTSLNWIAYTSDISGLLPTAGGTMTGELIMAANIRPSTDAQYSLGTSSKRFSAVYAGSFVKTGGTSSQFLKADGSVDSNTYATQTWVTSQGYLTSGNVVTTNTAQSIGGAKTFTATLTSSAGGSFTGGLRFYSICIECNSDGTPNSGRSGEINRYNGGTLHLQYDSGTGGVTMCQQGFTFTNIGSTRSITINASLQLTCGSGTPYTDKNWVYNSDMRKKDVIRLIDMDAQRIADAPIFDFTWKSDAVKELTLGSSAQYWQTVFPNAVRTTPDGYLGMDYSSIALASAVLTARKVVDHEKRIRLLEVENEALRREIDQLKLKNAA